MHENNPRLKKCMNDFYNSLIYILSLRNIIKCQNKKKVRNNTMNLAQQKKNGMCDLFWKALSDG